MHTASPAISSILKPVEAPSQDPRWLAYPLTVRGTLVAGVITYALLGPARMQADIIAATVGYTAAALFTALLLTTAICAMRLRRTVRLEVGGESGAAQHVAGRATTLVLKLPRFSILPGFILTLQPAFNSTTLALPEFRLAGSATGPRYLAHPITFPHRGIWTLSKVRIQFGDQLGLTQLRWTLSGDTVQRRFAVTPPPYDTAQMPIISSFERPGDLATQAQERLGDPLDIRRYEPTDGARRIVWKIFARKGELVSRHPEASMSPEGRVVMFAPALPCEDPVCSSMIQYADQLRGLNLEIVAGCSGMADAIAATSPETLQTLLINSVWNSDQSEQTARAELTALIERLTRESKGEKLQRVALFTSTRRFRTPRDRSLVLGLAASLQSYGITPIFFVVSERTELNAFFGQSLPARSTVSIKGLLTTWFTDTPQAAAVDTTAEYRAFLNACAQSAFEVVFLRAQ